MAGNLMYLYGKNSVLERIKANPRSIKNIFLQENFESPQIFDAIKKNKIPVVRVSEKELYKIKRADRMQGIAALVDRFLYTPFKELLDRPQDKKLSLIFLDSLNDPHNLGTIIRMAACFGGFGIVIPKHNSCEVNDTVLHVASGGENFVPVSLVTNLSTSLIEAKKSGYWVVGAVIEGGEDLTKTKLPFPLCLVLGSEGEGIRQGLEKQLDVKVTLPMVGAALSFNVAMAASIFCYEITKQQKP